MSTAEQTSSEFEQRVIKRYSNRKLYDTRDSRYVTLQQIGEMVRRGEHVQIIDNKTKEDKTEVTLALILSEDLKNKPSSVPLAALRELIQERSDRFVSQLRGGPLGRFMARDEDEEGMPASAPLAPDNGSGAVVAGAVAASGASSVKAAPGAAQEGDRRPMQQRINEWMDSSRHSLELLQTRVDESLRSLPGLALVHEVHELRATVRALQARLEAVERASGIAVAGVAVAGVAGAGIAGAGIAGAGIAGAADGARAGGADTVAGEADDGGASAQGASPGGAAAGE